jgi:flagellin
LKADTRLFNQEVRNLNDGLSLLNIADGALNELSNIVTRLSELSEQSANGTLGNKQRLSLDQEAQSLSKEYNRIARSTEFNGRKIFNGDFGNLSLAAGGSTSSLITDGLGGAIGDGSFETSTMYGGAGIPQIVMVGDFNQDNISDLVSLSIADRFNIFVGNGNGTFKSSISTVTGNDPYSMQIGDVNGDGIIELIFYLVTVMEHLKLDFHIVLT